MTSLSRFLARTQGRDRFRAHVKARGFLTLYLRWTERFVGNDRVWCIDIATVEAARPGSGAFTDLVTGLHDEGYNLYVESVLTSRFAEKLEEMGFTRLGDGDLYPSFFLSAESSLNDDEDG